MVVCHHHEGNEHHRQDACMVRAVAQSPFSEDARQTCDYLPRKEREAFARRAQIPRSPKSAARDDKATCATAVCAAVQEVVEKRDETFAGSIKVKRSSNCGV